MSSVVTMLFAAREVAVAWGPSHPGIWLSLGAGLGAASYAALLRSFGFYRLSPRAILSIALACTLAMPLAFLLGSALGVLSGLWFAVCWWFAASGSLWYQDTGTSLNIVGTRRSDAGNS